MAKLIDNSIPKFLLVGVGNTLLSMVLMFLLEGLGYWPSTAISTATSPSTARRPSGARR